MTTRHTHQQSIRLPHELVAAVDREAERRGLSRADAMRLLMAEALGQPELAQVPDASRAGAALRCTKSPQSE